MRKYTLKELNNIEIHFKRFKNEIINTNFDYWVELVGNVIEQAKGNVEQKNKLPDANYGKIGIIGGKL